MYFQNISVFKRYNSSRKDYFKEKQSEKNGPIGYHKVSMALPFCLDCILSSPFLFFRFNKRFYFRHIIEFWRRMKVSDFCCGLLAGWTQVVVGQPFDFVKVKIQTALKDMPILSIARDIKNQFGLRGFYRGSSSLFFGFAFVIGTQFLVYEWAKRFIFRQWGNRRSEEYKLDALGLWEVALAGGFVGWSVSAIYCPVEYVKIQKQLHGEVKQSAIGLLFSQVVKNRGRNIFRGYWSTVLRETWGSFFYYGSYEAMVRSLANRREKASTLNFLMAGAIAGITYHLLTYPIDTLKTNIQAGSGWREGLAAAVSLSKLKGYKVVLVRAGLVNSSSFLVYQKAQECVTAFQAPYYSVY